MSKNVAPPRVFLLLLGTCLAGCTGLVPNQASFNGVTSLNPATGSAQVSVSALRNQEVLSSGQLSSPRATVSEVVSTALSVQQSYQATASICGDIVSQGQAITAVLTLDATGSMSRSDPNELRGLAAKNFVERMGAEDLAAVASFDSSTDPTPPYTAVKVWQPFTSDKSELNTAIDNATYESGGTNLWDAGVDSVALLSPASGTNKIAVLLTDGEDNDSLQTPEEVIDAARNAQVKIYAIGLEDVDTADLINIVGQTGGTFNQVDEAADLPTLFDGAFNASRASGCVSLTFAPVPPSGTVLGGALSFSVDGVPLTTQYTVRFP